MVINNLWQDKIDSKLFDLLTKYIEIRSSHCRSGASLPKEATRHVFTTFRNKQDNLCYRMEAVTGIEEGRSTSPKFHTRVDEFGYAFRSLTDKEQLLILGYADPFDEMNSKEDFREHLNKLGIGKEQEYWKLLENTFLKLQNILEKRGLVDKVDDILTTWNDISQFLKMSIPTVKKLIKEGKLTVSKIGGRVIASKTRLEKDLQSVIDENNYNKGR